MIHSPCNLQLSERLGLEYVDKGKVRFGKALGRFLCLKVVIEYYLLDCLTVNRSFNKEISDVERRLEKTLIS